MAKKETEQAKKRITDFLALSWCIDGKAEFISDTKIFVDGKEVLSAIFRLTDSKRGTFYVTISQ